MGDGTLRKIELINKLIKMENTRNELRKFAEWCEFKTTAALRQGIELAIENYIKEQCVIPSVSVTLCKCGGKKYKQRMFEMDYLTCEECGISKLA